MSAIGFYATQTTGETSPLGNVDKEENRRQDTNRIMICSYCKRYLKTPARTDTYRKIHGEFSTGQRNQRKSPEKLCCRRSLLR